VSVPPLTIRWNPPPTPGRTLFIVCAYHGRDHDGRPGLVGRLERGSARGHRIVHRDHYANPRPLSYVIELVQRALAELPPASKTDLVFDRRFDAEVPEAFTPLFARTETADVIDARCWRDGLLRESPSFNNLVLVYTDALGLGCHDIEGRALSGRAGVFIVNGRRRAFRVDRTFHWRLGVHRWLASTRIVERTLALVVRPLAGTLAAWDRLAGARS
jgi:hypothetical protein